MSRSHHFHSITVALRRPPRLRRAMSSTVGTRWRFRPQRISPTHHPPQYAQRQENPRACDHRPAAARANAASLRARRRQRPAAPAIVIRCRRSGVRPRGVVVTHIAAVAILLTLVATSARDGLHIFECADHRRPLLAERATHRQPTRLVFSSWRRRRVAVVLAVRGGSGSLNLARSAPTTFYLTCDEVGLAGCFESRWGGDRWHHAKRCSPSVRTLVHHVVLASRSH